MGMRVLKRSRASTLKNLYGTNGDVQHPWIAALPSGGRHDGHI